VFDLPQITLARPCVRPTSLTVIDEGKAVTPWKATVNLSFITCVIALQPQLGNVIVIAAVIGTNKVVPLSIGVPYV
jgi:hypothetical protein